MEVPQPRSPGHVIHKNGPSLQNRWKTYIDAEQNTVEALLASSFKTMCRDIKANDNAAYQRMRADSFNSSLSGLSRGSCSSTSTAITDLYSGQAGRSAGIPMNRAAYSHGTLPRNLKQQLVKSDSCSSCGHHGAPGSSAAGRPPLGIPPGELDGGAAGAPVRRLSFTSQHPRHHGSSHQLATSSHHLSTSNPGSNSHLPAGIAELETMYKAMKNLNSPLPNAPLGTTLGKMPAVYPLRHRSVEDSLDNLDTMSNFGEIPPPPPPVQSHAILEFGLGHEIVSRTPGTLRKHMDWPKPPNIPLPPLPPKRTSSRLSDMMRPANLNLSGDSDTSIYSRPKPFHRSSLMSTGSSDSGSGSSLPSEPELPMSPLTPSSELAFSWPNYSISGSPDHRSVSQACRDREDAASLSSGNNSANTSMTSHSGVYVKMHPVFSPDNPDSPYMNLLYSAVQQQGGKGSVETAMSPYLAMTGFTNNNVRNLENAAIDSVSAIYAQIDSSKGSLEEIRTSPKGGKATPSPSKSTKQRSSSSKTRALAEFRELMLEVERKRNFRVGLNLFNTHPDIGIDYMVKQGFLELSPMSVAKFLQTTTDLSKAKIGEYLGQLQNAFSMKTLSCFLEKFDFTGLRVDKALRKFLKAVQVPGEAQKIEKMMEVFGKRFLKCNPGFSSKLKSSESIVTLAFAVMLLNTDLHTPNLKPDKKMLEKDFTNNLKGADAGQDFDSKLLKAIYKGIKKQEFESGVDHVTQTQLLRTRITGKAPGLSEPHRRLVCLCRLAEVADINTKKENEASSHYRDIWLFNDMMLMTKMAGKNASGPVYSYRDSFHLTGLEVTLFHTPVYRYGIQISRKGDNMVLSTLNAASEQDRYKFVMDLQESIFEMDMMGRALRDANLIK